MEKINFENKELCAECGGKCCKSMPGICQPEDFGQPLTEKIAEALATKKYAIDWWNGDPRINEDEDEEMDRTYYIRPAIKGIQKIFHGSWGGECIFLTDTGCSLEHNKRPYTCRMLEPQKDKNCQYHGMGKRDETIRWIPFQNNILDAVRKVGEISDRPLY